MLSLVRPSLETRKERAYQIGDPPPLYLSILDQMDPSSTGSVSLSAAHRVLSTSKLPAATIEKVNPPSKDTKTQG
jgi:hypothetical protein